MAQTYHEKSNHFGKDDSSFYEDMVKKYIELFDRLPIGIYRTTPDGKVVAANPKFLNMLGYSAMDDLEGIDLNATHKNPEAREQFRREIEEKGEIYAKESILVSREGQDIIVEEYAKVYHNSDHDILFYEGIVIDATQKKKDADRIKYLISFKDLIFGLATSFINVRPNDIDNKIVHALQSIGDFLKADRSYVFLFDDPEMKFMSNTHESVAEGIRPVINDLQELDTSQFPWWMDNLKKNKSIIIYDTNELSEKAAAEKKLFAEQEIKSLFAVPMFFNYRLIGFLGFDMVRDYRTFDSETLELLDIVALIFANILNYQEVEQKLINSQKNLELLIEQRTKELETANLHLRLIAENSYDVIWTMDLDLKTTFMSPSVSKHLGYTPEEYMALPLEERLPEESWLKIRDYLQNEHALIKQGLKKPDERNQIFELLHKHKDGRLIWGELSINYIIDSHGNPIGIYGIARNIHDRKLAEIALWESNERFKALVENTTDWIWEVDPNGKYTYSSPMCHEITGYTCEELIGKYFYDLSEPETLDESIQFFKNNADARKPFQNFQNVAIHKNGKRIYLETSGIPIFDINRKFKGYRGIDRDITEKMAIETALRNSQLKLSQHLRNTALGYIEWDPNYEVIEWNTAAKMIFGFTKSQAMVEDIIHKIIPVDQHEPKSELFPDIFEKGKSYRQILNCTDKNGTTVRCEWFNTPIFDESDQIICVSSLVRSLD